MAYITGSANNFSELNIALSGLLTDNGWSDAGSGDFTKGQISANLYSSETPAATNGLNVKLKVLRTAVAPGTHRFWRIYGVTSESGAISASKITFRETSGGANVATGGTAIASGYFGTSVPAMAFDGDNSTYWDSGAVPAWIGYDFGSGVTREILEFSYRVRPGANYTQAPTSGILQYSDDGVTWYTSYLSWSEVSWASLETKVFTMPTPGTEIGGIPAPQPSVLASPSSAAAFNVNWPVTYHGFISHSPEEVVFIALDGNQRVYYVAFGDSDIPHLSGDGLWQAGTARVDFRNSDGLAPIGIRAANAIQSYAQSAMNCMPFWGASYQSIASQRNFDASWVSVGGSWLYTGNGGNYDTSPPNGVVSTRYFDFNQYNLLPNAWNTETVLLPYKCYASPATGSSQLVLDFKSIRKCRTDNFENGDIVEFAGDKWMIFSIYKKDSVNRNGTNTTSGTHGIAIHYDGP